jgi:hypothetical protein
MSVSGFQVGSNCFATSAQANAAYYSTAPSFLSGSGTFVQFVQYGGPWAVQTCNNAGACSAPYLIDRFFAAVPDCDPALPPFNSSSIASSLSTIASAVVPSSTDTVIAFNDGVTMGWGVGAAMIAVFAAMLIRRALP